MSKYDEGMKLMEEAFGNGKDNCIAISTIALSKSNDGKPMPIVRTVDAFYEDGIFYVVTNALSNKMKQIKENPQVSIAGCIIEQMFTGIGIGENLGWALDPKNKDIRTKLRKAFEPWYDMANNEKDENCCYLAIHLTKGTFNFNHWEKLYHIDFHNKKIMERNDTI